MDDGEMKIIRIYSCSECPYLKSDRYFYCGKRFRSCPEAYKAGAHAEYSREINWLMKQCPLEEMKK